MKKELQLNESLAALGHGKWKRALGCTLLIMGLLMGGMNAWGQAPENGLYMHKTWEPDYTNCPDGSCGQIRLETFVTGESMTINTHVPTDIVLVLDRSGSMEATFGSTTRIEALIEGVQTFLNIILQDAAQYNCDHRVAGVGFSTISTTAIVTTEEEVLYGTNSGNTLVPNTITTANADEALRYVNTGTQTAPVLNTYLGSFFTDQIEDLQSGGTHPECGLSLAYDILDKRTIKTYNAGTEEEPNWVPRSQVVVFFTDGAPGNTSSPKYFYNTESLTSTQNQAYIADLAVAEANEIKDIGATIFSVGVITGADENAAYTSSPSYSGSTINYYTTVTQCTNGFLHFVSSNYGSTTNGVATSFRGLTTSTDNTANKFPDSKYIVADDASELNAIFTNIAQQSGGAAMEMGTSTVVKDVVTADFNFNIPVGSTIDRTIKAYMPKCTGFEDANNNGKYDSGEVLNFDALQEGALEIVEGIAQGNENKLPDGTVSVNETTKTLTLSGINFDHMWCGPELNSSQQITGWHGRKLVILIPLVIAGNTWGDGITTNTPMSIILPNGDELHPLEFNIPVADVLGEVWTEVVTDKPSTFDATANPIPLTTPEDLAWFISYVNGRMGYEINGDEVSHPTASAILMADIDMSAHNWVPIGTNQPDGTIVSYQGTFDGNGHVITGLKNNAGKQFLNGKISWVFPGMFNKVGNGGVVKNVFVLDADFRGQQRTIGEGATAKDVFVHHGIIADTLLSGGQIFNCEAAGRISCKSNEANTNLIFGGLVGLNNGGIIHSCMAMAELTGYTMGGMIGENRTGTFSNGFTNGVYNYLDDNAEDISVGGLAGINGGTFSNCYVRFERENTNLDKVDNFGQLVGSGTGSVSLCYTPENFSTIPETPAGTTYTTYTNTTPASRIRQDRSNDNMVGGEWIMDNTILNGGTPLLTQLISGKGSGASWKRTTAGGFESGSGNVCGNINGDYPILEFTGYTCVASADGIRLDYAASLDEMLDRHNLGNMNVGTNMPSEGDWYTDPDMPVASYAVTQSPAIYGGAINLYDNDNTTKSTSTTAKTVVYIDENISLLQDDGSNIDAYTGQTIKDFGSSYSVEGNRWHNVSSSLQNSKFGWTYWDNDTETDYTNIEVPHNWESNPCYIWLETSNDDEAIFPIDTRSPHAIDFYCFYEPQYHWLNFKRNSLSHWHMDNYELNIPYNNEDHFIPGKGYLLALYTEYFANHHIWNGDGKDGTFLQNRGTLNNGNVPVAVTANAPEWTGLKGYNLLGNPYQSFLDFSAFANATENEGLWEGSKFARTCAIFDPSDVTTTGATGGSYVQYIANASKGAKVAGPTINMHQGFFIQVAQNGTATFTNDMRTNDATPNFRGEQPAYPLINFILTDNEGETDIAVLELNRPENDGARKLRMGSPAGRIYFRYDDTNLAIYFRNSDKDYQTLNFAAEEDGNFTLNWNTANADFRSLTLVDNITGIKTDMLTHDHYTFEGRMDDYNTRFKIVFGEMDNNEEEPVLEHFAFFDHGNLIVNGTGHFEVVDVMGRVLYAIELTDTQNTVSLPSNVRGVCMLCFTRNNETKVQKMVIQ